MLVWGEIIRDAGQALSPILAHQAVELHCPKLSRGEIFRLLQPELEQSLHTYVRF